MTESQSTSGASVGPRSTASVRATPAPKQPRGPTGPSLKRKQKVLLRAQAEAAQVERERKRLKYFLILMVTTWPVGLFWGWAWAIYIATGWLCFWIVGRYLNYFHRRNARIRLATALEDMQSFLESHPEAADAAMPEDGDTP